MRLKSFTVALSVFALIPVALSLVLQEMLGLTLFGHLTLSGLIGLISSLWLRVFLGQKLGKATFRFANILVFSTTWLIAWSFLQPADAVNSGKNYALVSVSILLMSIYGLAQSASSAQVRKKSAWQQFSRIGCVAALTIATSAAFNLPWLKHGFTVVIALYAFFELLRSNNSGNSGVKS